MGTLPESFAAWWSETFGSIQLEPIPDFSQKWEQVTTDDGSTIAVKDDEYAILPPAEPDTQSAKPRGESKTVTIMDEVSNVTPQQLAALSAKVQDTEEPSMEETTMEATQQERGSQRIQHEPGTYRDYDFHGRTIRTVIIDGALWFVARDVAICLGYEKPRNAISRHCRGALKRGVPTESGIQEMLIIQKHDVFRLVMHSTLPEAEQFQDWVYMEVLPSIDEKGGYVQDGREQEFLEKTGVSDAIKTLIDNPSQSLLVLSEMTRALVDARKETEAERQARLQAEKEKWQAQREAAENRLALTHVELQVEEMTPDAEFGRSLCAVPAEGKLAELIRQT